MTAGVVTFDPTAFKLRYPEFAAVADGTLSYYFTEATLYLSNATNSPVSNLTRRSLLLNMLTAHCASLGGVLNAGSVPGPVGRVSQAAEGTVNATLEYLEPGSNSWFTQTPYGAAYWQAILSYRSFRYRPYCAATRAAWPFIAP